jgi:hypothetical protein
MIREAEEFVWTMSDQIPASFLPLVIDGFERGVECRKILPRNANIPSGIFAMANNPVFAQAARKNLMESRYLDKIDVVVGLSEKEKRYEKSPLERLMEPIPRWKSGGIHPR